MRYVYEDKDVKDKQQKTKIKYTDYDGDVREIITRDESICKMMNRFAKIANLYSCFIDVNGRLIGEPVGPVTNLGDFYDLFETPMYKEYYVRLKNVMLDRCKPYLFKREIGEPRCFVAAPISMKERLLGFWVLASYTMEETERLATIYREQWDVAGTISELIYSQELLHAERETVRITKQHLEQSLARERILELALRGMNRKNRSIEQNAIDDIASRIGECLKVSAIYFFAPKELGSKELILHTSWFRDANEPEFEDDKWLLSELEQSETAFLHPILLDDELFGKLFLVSDANRVWEQHELKFSDTIKHIIQNLVEVVVDDSKLRQINNQLIETYNNFNVGIFIRDARSGKVLFSNAMMNEMIGRDFTGGDSRVILTDLHDRFAGMDGMRKPFITKEKVTNWRRYIQSFDTIMDITEIQIEWLQGEPASLVILRKAKDI